MIKGFLATSIIFNCIMTIMVLGIVPFLLYLSILINLFLIWYIKNTLTQHNQLSDDLEEMFANLDNFIVHLESLYQLETFYGDETLKSLLQHAKETIENLDFYRDRYSLLEAEESFTQEGINEEEIE